MEARTTILGPSPCCDKHRHTAHLDWVILYWISFTRLKRGVSLRVMTPTTRTATNSFGPNPAQPPIESNPWRPQKQPPKTTHKQPTKPKNRPPKKIPRLTHWKFPLKIANNKELPYESPIHPRACFSLAPGPRALHSDRTPRCVRRVGLLLPEARGCLGPIQQEALFDVS